MQKKTVGNKQISNRIPYTKKDFAWVHWTAADIKRLAPKIIEEKKARLKLIKKVLSAERTFENTVYALEASDYGLADLILKIDLLQNVSPDKKVRDEAMRAIQLIEKKLIVVEHDKAIWGALKVYERGAWRRERACLGEDDKKLFRDTFLSYKRMGFDLAPEKQKRLKAIKQRLARLANEFRHNINNYRDHIVVTDEELSGLPERYRAGLKRDKRGRALVTLAYPDYHPFMELAHDATKRKELAEKFLRKGGDENMIILEEMLALRAERAKLLGYAHHADYQTELRMAKSGEVALAFEERLLKKVARGGKRDLEDLRDLKRERTGDKNAVLEFYDIAYYGHELQKRRFHFDSEELRTYFPLEQVLEGTFTIYATLFGVTFEKVKISLWHPDATLFAIKDTAGTVLSYFALDLYPREGKYGHAAAFGIVAGRTASFCGDEYVAPFATMVTNFSKPVKGHPSLLSHGEVETFLHEFGHIMHYTLTNARHASQSGYHTAWDFVEAPSQMLEHWAWNKKSLDLLAAHQKTRKPIPPVLMKNLLKSRDHLLRYGVLRQLILGIFDLTLHATKNPPNPNKLYKSLVRKYVEIELPTSSIFPAGFGHLDGYDAGYYGYMWSNVFAADMFTRFAKEGILNKKTGKDYRAWILEKGGSGEEIDLIKGFLGRKPSNEAFLKEIGVQ